MTAKLLRLGPIDVVQVTRYDRLRGPGRAVRRLHQEDFCQALGFAPNAKYEEEGGPTLAACHALLRQVSSLPAIDSRAFLSWQVANLLLRNADAHAKNLALVYHQDSGCRLAPFYDVVCTGVYQKLARRLPMRIGGATHSEGIAHRQWLDHARSLGVPGRFLLLLVSDVADRIEAALPRARTTFRERYGDSPILGRILHESRKQIRHTRRLLE